MRAREIVKELITQKGYGNAEFARILGIEPTALWDRLNNKKVRDIPTSLLNEMLKPLGYKLQIVPSETPLPVDSFEVETNTAPPEKSKIDLDALLSTDEPKRPKK